MENTAAIIKQAFDPYFQLPLEVWNSFARYGSIAAFPKNEVIKRADSTERYLSFILSGSGGILLPKKEHFACLDLCYENEFFGDYMSFLTQSPSPLEVVLFEDSTLFRISYPKFSELSNTEHGLRICKAAAEALFIHKQQQQIDLLLLTATERYRQLLSRQPEVVRRTPQKHIASYLGIIPESLSRIRKNITR